jgi:AraC-like DNA-binding protein
MTPGSVLLGNAGECFHCEHEHGTGDRCLSFSYDPEFFDRLTHDAGASGTGFRMLRLPSDRVLAPIIAKAAAVLAGDRRLSLEELSILTAAKVAQLERGVTPNCSFAERNSVARVTRVVRMMENDPDCPSALRLLAQMAGLSPFHFLRNFAGLTGITPHQFLLRLRLRSAAVRLRTGSAKILDIALDCGFADVSNFNRAFRAEFGMSPRVYRSS